MAIAGGVCGVHRNSHLRTPSAMDEKVDLAQTSSCRSPAPACPVVTKAGSPCKNKVKEGGVCGVHRNSPLRTPVDEERKSEDDEVEKRCPRKTRKGTPCRNRVREYGVCGVHKNRPLLETMAEDELREYLEQVRRLMVAKWQNYKENCLLTAELKAQLAKGSNDRLVRNCRRPNFPEVLSEYIICCQLPGCERREFVGDLQQGSSRVEVKATVKGPISFGPRESWDVLYVLDCRNDKEEFWLYRIPLSNIDDQWRQLKVSESDTFEMQATAGKRRPRITLDKLLPQVPHELVTHGSIPALLNTSKK
jgi:hypothetical protein